MILIRGRNPRTEETVYTLWVPDYDLIRVPLDPWDVRLIADCDGSTSIADTLLALELIARRLEQYDSGVLLVRNGDGGEHAPGRNVQGVSGREAGSEGVRSATPEEGPGGDDVQTKAQDGVPPPKDFGPEDPGDSGGE